MHIQAPHFRRLFVLFSLMLLVSCGFHMRGLTELPFKTLYIKYNGAANAALVKELRRAMNSNGITLTPTEEGADMQLEIMGEKIEKKILSLSGGGTVREYELIYHVTFRLRQSGSELWSAPQLVEQRRDYSYDDTQVLAKEGEEARLYSDMRSDSTREIMRRLNAIKVSKPATAN